MKYKQYHNMRKRIGEPVNSGERSLRTYTWKYGQQIHRINNNKTQIEKEKNMVKSNKNVMNTTTVTGRRCR